MKYLLKYKIFENNMDKEYLINLIEDVVDFPKPGIIFKDISVLLSDGLAIRIMVDKLLDFIKDRNIDIILGLDARGFILGATLSEKIGCGFAMARKAGKAPPHYIYKKYDLEYGSGEMGISPKIIKPGMRVHIHDDLLATGGTICNIIQLVEEMGAIVDSTSFIIELDELGGRGKIKCDTFSILNF